MDWQAGPWIGERGLSVSEGAVAALRTRLTDAARGHSGDDLRDGDRDTQLGLRLRA
jgi:hypothetical protein